MVPILHSVLPGLALILAAVTCTADTVTWTPTPTYRWDHDLVDTAGFRIYWKHADVPVGTWSGSFDLPLQTYVDEDTFAVGVFASGRDSDYPVQRAIQGENLLIRFHVRAFDAENRESLPSTEMELCLPAIWQSGESYR